MKHTLIGILFIPITSGTKMLELPENMEFLWNTLSKYVKEVCADRDPSHGHEHMQKVAENSIKILNEMNYMENNFILMHVIIVAWLHDVCDHKYGDHLKSNMQTFLLDNHFDDPEYIFNIIDRISYSKEDKCIKQGVSYKSDWMDVLGEDGCIIRDIVSDADKLEAIGKIGIERCIEYTRHKNVDITQHQLNIEVHKHAEEKLLRLKDEFIRTEPGKRMAEPLHRVMVDMLKNM